MDYIDWIRALSPEKRALLRERNPLSFAQERLWFLDQLDPDSGVYNIPAAVLMKGDLDTAVLERAINEILRRHDILRTTFPAIEGRPFQVVARSLTVTLTVVDLTDLPGDGKTVELQKRVREEGQRPFDLARGPLVRALLFRLGEQEHALMFNMHHIISDGGSMPLLIREVNAIYEAFSREEPSPLPELPIQYADFALWQREHLEGKVLDQQLEYWTNQLRGAPALLELPTDKARPKGHSATGGYEFFEVPQAQTEAINSLSRQESATPFMTLLTAFNVLLHKYTGKQDIVVGIPIAGRNRPELESLIGFFVNTLAVRTVLNDGMTFRELLRRSRENTLAAFANQDLPFERLVEELQPARTMDHAPLVQVTFALNNLPDEELNLQGQTLNGVDVESDTVKFDLILMMREVSGELTGSLGYNAQLYSREMICGMIGHFNALLRGIAANPDERISDLDFLSEDERRQLLIDFNSTKSEYPGHLGVHQVFEEQVRLRGDAVAVVFQGQQTTYAELNRRANQLASFLRARGVGPEGKVGICIERSLETIVAILGVLKTGGCYVPLEPDYPSDRLNYMINDCQLGALIVGDGLPGRLSKYSGAVVSLRECQNQLEQEPDGDAPALSAGSSVAYVMYTSGSTGKPVGIAIPHRGITRLVKQTNYVRIESSDVFLQMAPVSFDASTFEIWGALLNGARLAIYPPGPFALDEVGGILSDLRVTTLWLTAGLFQQMVDHHLEGLKHLDQLLAGGDV